MDRGKFLALLATLVVVAGAGYWAWSGFKSPPLGQPAAIVTTPPGWIRLDGGDFTLYAPGGSRLRKAQGVDFQYGDVTGPRLCARFQTGRRVGVVVNKQHHPEFSETSIVIDGHPGTLRKAMLAANEQQYWFPGCGAPLYYGLYVPQALADGAGFVIEVSADSEEGLDEAVMMFKTIRFARPR